VTDKTPTEQYVEYRDEVWDKDPHYRGLFDTLKELTEETDRGVALVTTSFLDRLLGDTLAAFLIENASAKVLLSGFNAPLGTLNTKIAACHALGLITDEEFGQCSISEKSAMNLHMRFRCRSKAAKWKTFAITW
jgi:mannitol operon repressor